MQEGSKEVLEEAPEEEPLEEGRLIKGQQRVVKPSKEEWENHMRTHIPYRKWCPHCVMGKRKSGVHSSIQDDLKEEEEVPVIPSTICSRIRQKARKKILGCCQY